MSSWAKTTVILARRTGPSIETVSWLRLIGYNALSAWRTLAPSKDGKPIWARTAETLRHALVLAEIHHVAIPLVT